jgi:hypothetical protein
MIHVKDIAKSVTSPHYWTVAFPDGSRSNPSQPYPQVWSSLADAFALLGEDDATLHVPLSVYRRLPLDVQLRVDPTRRVRKTVGNDRFRRAVSVGTEVVDDPTLPYPVLVGAIRGLAVAVTRVVESRADLFKPRG